MPRWGHSARRMPTVLPPPGQSEKMVECLGARQRCDVFFSVHRLPLGDGSVGFVEIGERNQQRNKRVVDTRISEGPAFTALRAFGNALRVHPIRR